MTAAVIDLAAHRAQRARVIESLLTHPRDVYRKRGDEKPKPHPDGPVIRPLPPAA